MTSRNVDLLTLAAWSRFSKLRDYAHRHLKLQAQDFAARPSSLRILFGGDVMFDPVVRQMWNLGLYRQDFSTHGRTPTITDRVRRKLWRRIVKPLLSPDYYSQAVEGPFSELAVHKPERSDTIRLDARERYMRSVDLDWKTVRSDFDFPFRKIRQLFETKDLVILNLETPLTDHRRDEGLFKSHPGYAKAMRAAGVSLVNVSNNHIFDAGETGFVDTFRHLSEAGLPQVGAGENFESARAGTLVTVRDTRLLLLSYTQFCNARFASLANQSVGLLPLDRRLMIEDVRAGLSNADLVIVSVHWGIENQPRVHPSQVEIAHQLIDAGACAVVGHHPHVPHGVEVYRNRPIVYSLGNLIFAQSHHPSWGDNFLAELVIENKHLQGLIVHPVAGQGVNQFQPSPLRGAAAEAFLTRLQLLSLPFRTAIALRDDVGYVGLN